MKKLPSHGGDYNFYKKEIKYDFSINVNPLGFPVIVKKLIKENINHLDKYPEIYAESLVDKLSDFYNCSNKNILVGNGSIQFIYLLPIAFKFKNSVIVVPNFSEYEKSLKLFNTNIIFYYLNENSNFSIDLNNFFHFLNKINFDSIFITNPSNPCGNLIDFFTMKEIAKYCKKNDKYLIVDEAFIDFTDGKGLINLSYKKLIVLRSFTKNFSIPGLRIGVIKSDKESISKVKKFLPPWSLNSFSIEIGKFLLEQQNYLIKSKNYIKKEKKFLLSKFKDKRIFKIFPSDANYLLIKILKKDLDAFKLSEFLINHHILIRNCANYTGLNSKFFRICIKKRKENSYLLNTLFNLPIF